MLLSHVLKHAVFDSWWFMLDVNCNVSTVTLLFSYFVQSLLYQKSKSFYRDLSVYPDENQSVLWNLVTFLSSLQTAHMMGNYYLTLYVSQQNCTCEYDRNFNRNTSSLTSWLVLESWKMNTGVVLVIMSCSYRSSNNLACLLDRLSHITKDCTWSYLLVT